MDFQSGIFVVRQHGECGVARPCSHFEQGDRAGVFLRYVIKNGKLLLKPFSVLEKVSGIVLVKEVPPFCRV